MAGNVLECERCRPERGAAIAGRYELTEDLAPQAKTLVFSAKRTDANPSDCMATAEWEDPHLG